MSTTGNLPAEKFAAEAGKALDDLERWKSGKKSRAVTISIGNGYGADCWCVKLHGFAEGKITVTASEVCFIGGDKESDFPRTTTFARPPWVEQGDDDPDWPGLARTIQAAITRADELGL